MMAGRNSLESIARHLIRATAPLAGAGASPQAFTALVSRLGFKPTSVPPAVVSLSASVTTANVTVDGFSANASLQDILSLLSDAKTLFDSIGDLATSPPAGVDAGAWTAEITDGLFGMLVVDYLSDQFPTALGVLGSLGVITFENRLATPTRASFVQPRIAWESLGDMISDPAGWPGRIFGWGGPSFDASAVVEDVLRIFRGLGFTVFVTPLDDDRVTGYGIDPQSLTGRPYSLKVPFIGTRFAGQPLTASFSLHPLPPVGSTLPGIALEADLPSALPLTLQLHPKAKLRLRAGTNGAPFGIAIRPGSITVHHPLDPAATPATALGVGFDFTTEAPVLLFGDPKASRLQFSGSSLDLNLAFNNGAWSVTLAPTLSGLKIILDAGSGDSFLRKILGAKKVELGIPLGLEWNEAHGIRFTGSAAFDVTMHPHAQLGPARVDDVDLRVAVTPDDPPAATVEVGASVAGELGPLKVFIDGVGVRGRVAFAPGNAGPLDVGFGFKPPRGVGLEIDAGGFKGGGFLVLDPAKGEYAGGLELMFQGIVSVRAVGILTTRMPDGSDGFSLLLIIVSEFPPLQLSFGFTLLGVGGLLGLNRTVMLDALQLGVRDGTLNSILFPVDIASNAGRIISDLRRVFPPQDGRFLIGPMAKLGWGTPTLISLELGVILEIPRPMFAIVGVLRMALPSEDTAILHIQVSFAGSVDFDKGQLSFDASLYDSRVLNFTLTGDMAVRLYWKENANFLLTVGGFHPAYTPPPMNLGEISRLGISMFQGNPSLRAEAYFALTSNTVQFGARVEAYFGVDVFNVYGFLGLDALIHFDPFHFIAELGAMLAVRSGRSVLFSINVALLLEGPSPWHARGRGSFSVSFIVDVTFSVHFDVTIGAAENTKLAPVDVLASLVDALSQNGNWRPRLPANSNQHVVLREPPAGSPTLILHPFGSLEVVQKIAPLDMPIQRFGSRSPADGTTFSIVNVKVDGAETITTPTLEEFAPAQFFEMSDAEMLSRPSFATYRGGVQIGGDLAPKTDFMRRRDVRYELSYLPERHPFKVMVVMVTGLASFLIQGAAVAVSALSHARRKPSPLTDPVSVVAEQYAVASRDTLTLHASDLVFDNATEADQALSALFGNDPSLRSSIQVVPTTSLRAA